MKTLLALLAIVSAALIAILAAEPASVSVVIGTQVTTNVASLRDVNISFSDGAQPSASVTYAFESFGPSGIKTVIGSTNIQIPWAALTNRYPEAVTILTRMQTDATARFAATNSP
jgi:hypothetical protein